MSSLKPMVWIGRLSQVRMRRRLAVLPLLFLLPGLLSGCVHTFHSESGEGTTVVLIRHTERSMLTGSLTAEGHERAQALVQALGDTRVDAIYSPKLERNIDTVKPLARHLGVDISLVDEKLGLDDIVGLLLKNHGGKTVLWVGNTANLGEIYYRLGGQGEPPDAYGDLFVLTVPPQGATVVVKKRFGR